MTPFNFAPLYRSTIGFDRLAHLVDSLATTGEDGGYPPYNIERVAENSYRISMAVAGFTRADVNIEVKDTTLSVRGEKKLSDVGQPEYLHRGIAQRGFERRFQLADYVEVNGADIKDGMLHIELTRNIPERMKPRTITIGTGHIGTSDKAGQIETHTS